MAALETILRARALAKQGNTQRQIAQIMGISQSTVMRSIKAANNPELTELIESVKTEQPDIDDTELIGIVLEKQTAKHVEATETLSEDVKTQRSVELERLDGYTMVIEGIINNPNSKWDMKLKAIETGLRVHDRRSKYLGLDTPFKYEGSTSTSIVVNGVDMDKLR
jgi:predicted transcriptional regulator